MGAWGTGFWSDDMTLDIRGDYLRRLKQKLTSEEAVTQLVEIYEPDKDDGDLFWIAVALLQWDYGHLSEDVKAKALEGLHSGEDELRWAESSEKDCRKRKEVMAQVEQKLISVNEKPKKVRPYVKKKNRFKIGDIVSLRFGTNTPVYHAPEKFFPFYNLYSAVLIVDFRELDIGDIYFDPVLALYDWLGDSPAKMDDLEHTPFFKTDYLRAGEPHYFWAADMPWKRLYGWYDLNVIGHLDTIPNDLIYWLKNDPCTEKSLPWGTICNLIANRWLETGREIPIPRDTP